MWGFSRYNVIVQQVEGVSDLLKDVADRIEPNAHLDPDGVAPRLLEHLRAAAAAMDRRALRMLALYDPAARAMWRAGVRKDPRRGPAGDVAAAALLQAGAAAFRAMRGDADVDCSPMGQDWPTPAVIASESVAPSKRPKTISRRDRRKLLKRGR